MPNADAERSINATKPAANDQAPVRVNSLPTADTLGILCQAYGDVVIPGGNSFVGVYAKILQVSTPMTRGELQANHDVNGVQQTLGLNSTWEMNQKLTCLCGTNPNPYPSNWLNVVAVTSYYDPLAGKFVQEGDPKCIPFTGEAVLTCTIKATEQSKAQETEQSKAKACSPTLLTASNVSTTNQHHPVDRDGDWLLYRGLSVSRHEKNELMLDGEPLRARVLAVAATNVYWEHRVVNAGVIIKRGVIRRAVGDLMLAEREWSKGELPELESGPILEPGKLPVLKLSPFAYPEAPQYALLITQLTPGRKPFVHVLASECREHPDFVHLNPESQAIFRVNHSYEENVESGSFDLWVKVVTY